MYKIIGSDGKEYGPVSIEQLRQWLHQGRVERTTQAWREGGTEWKALADIPELDLREIESDSAVTDVNGPATGLIVTAAIGFVMVVLSVLTYIMGGAQGFAPPPGSDPAMTQILDAYKSLGLVLTALQAGAALVILLGAQKMKKMESHGWAMAASILAMVPCISPCCVVGIPMGIWSLVILARPEVRKAFP